MNKKFKKVFGILMIVCMFLTFSPLHAIAETEDICIENVFKESIQDSISLYDSIESTLPDLNTENNSHSTESNYDISLLSSNYTSELYPNNKPADFNTGYNSIGGTYKPKYMGAITKITNEESLTKVFPSVKYYCNGCGSETTEYFPEAYCDISLKGFDEEGNEIDLKDVSFQATTHPEYDYFDCGLQVFYKIDKPVKAKMEFSFYANYLIQYESGIYRCPGCGSSLTTQKNYNWYKYTYTWDIEVTRKISNINLRKKFEGLQNKEEIPSDFYMEYSYDDVSETLKLKDSTKINDYLYEWNVELPTDVDITFQEFNFQVFGYGTGIDGSANVIKKDTEKQNITFNFPQMLSNGTRTITNFYDYVGVNAYYQVQYFDKSGNKIKDTSHREGWEGETATPINEDYIIDGYIFDADDSRNILSKKLKENEENILKLYFYKVVPTVNLQFNKSIDSSDDDFNRLKLNKDDNYSFNISLTNQDTGEVINGNLDSQTGLNISNIPTGNYIIKELDDIWFDFYNIIVNSVSGVEFSKVDSDYILSIDESVETGANITIDVINKTEDDRLYDSKYDIENLFNISRSNEEIGRKTITITYKDALNDTIIHNETIIQGTSISAFPDVPNHNDMDYEFTGWSLSPDLEEPVLVEKDEISTYSDITVYAIYKKVKSDLDYLRNMYTVKIPSEEYPIVGESFYYEIKIFNKNDEDMDVIVTDKLDEKLTFEDVSDDGLYDKNTHIITWENVTVPANNSKTLYLYVNANTSGTISNTARTNFKGLTTSGETTITAIESR